MNVNNQVTLNYYRSPGKLIAHPKKSNSTPMAAVSAMPTNLDKIIVINWESRMTRVLSRNFGLGWKGAWHFHAQSPPPNHY